MILGALETNRTPLDEIIATLPASLRGFFQKVIDGVSGALQVTLIDTLVGEFHEKFNAMWNAPGDRDAARALRQCDRTHRETTVQVVNEVLASQLALLAKAIAGVVQKNGAGDEGMPDSELSIIELKVTRLEEQITTIEQMVE